MLSSSKITKRGEQDQEKGKSKLLYQMAIATKMRHNKLPQNSLTYNHNNYSQVSVACPMVSWMLTNPGWSRLRLSNFTPRDFVLGMFFSQQWQRCKSACPETLIASQQLKSHWSKQVKIKNYAQSQGREILLNHTERTLKNYCKGYGYTILFLEEEHIVGTIIQSTTLK